MIWGEFSTHCWSFQDAHLVEGTEEDYPEKAKKSQNSLKVEREVVDGRRAIDPRPLLIPAGIEESEGK